MPEQLRTARFVLRPYEADELPVFLGLALDPRVTRLVGDGSPWTTQRASARFASGPATHQAGQGLWLAVQDRTDGRHVGLVAVDTSGTQVELGIWVRPDVWSTGVGSEVLLAVLPELRVRFPHHVPVAEADVQHAVSDRLLRSVGFRRDHQGIGRYGNSVWSYVWTEPDT